MQSNFVALPGLNRAVDSVCDFHGWMTSVANWLPRDQISVMLLGPAADPSEGVLFASRGTMERNYCRCYNTLLWWRGSSLYRPTVLTVPRQSTWLVIMAFDRATFSAIKYDYWNYWLLLSCQNKLWGLHCHYPRQQHQMARTGRLGFIILEPVNQV